MAVLNSWKAIADHVGRTPRTLQRWEEERDLPVHRVSGRVYALTDELDRWMRTHTSPAAVQIDLLRRLLDVAQNIETLLKQRLRRTT